jgi:hypothetical protein
MIKTFRGILTDGGKAKIRLSTKKGKVGYTIVKFEGMPYSPGTVSQESVLKIYSITQTSVDRFVDFANNQLLAVLYVKQGAGDEQTSFHTVIFDNMEFNQDIYITHSDASTGEKCNYYIELETSTLSDNATLVSTLKDIRANPQVGA